MALAPRQGFHPDDTTPIPRPSTYYGRERYAAMRKAAQGKTINARQPVKTSSSSSTSATARAAESKSSEVQKADSDRRVPQQTTTPEQSTPTEPLAPAMVPGLVPGRIDKSVLTFAEPKRLRDKNHLKFVASQPCLVCGRQPNDPHHLRFPQLRAIGMNVSDEFTVPLCRGHHRQLHQTGNEVVWWKSFNISPLQTARMLREESHGRTELLHNSSSVNPGIITNGSANDQRIILDAPTVTTNPAVTKTPGVS
jgi:hypothetical protein